MASRALPQDYQPQAGDFRTQWREDGTWAFQVYASVDWVEMAPLSLNGYELSKVADGMQALGVREGSVYWRKDREMHAPVWWSCLKTDSNTEWRAPRYGLGELVWLRSDPAGKARTISGVDLIPAFEDHPSPQSEDEDLSTPQSWVYHFTDGTEEDEDNVLGRDELAESLRWLKGQPVPTGAGIDETFDPFLDDLP